MALLFIFSEAVLCVAFVVTLFVLRLSIEKLDMQTAVAEVTQRPLKEAETEAEARAQRQKSKNRQTQYARSTSVR
jgi:hypothetical protein